MTSDSEVRASTTPTITKAMIPPGTMMGHVASYALEQNRRQRKRLVALIEPAAIIVLGGIIALVIVGVVLALTSLSDVKF